MVMAVRSACCVQMRAKEPPRTHLPYADMYATRLPYTQMEREQLICSNARDFSFVQMCNTCVQNANGCCCCCCMCMQPLNEINSWLCWAHGAWIIKAPVHQTWILCCSKILSTCYPDVSNTQQLGAHTIAKLVHMQMLNFRVWITATPPARTSHSAKNHRKHSWFIFPIWYNRIDFGFYSRATSVCSAQKYLDKRISYSRPFITEHDAYKWVVNLLECLIVWLLLRSYEK